jgi:hypothetical protein
MPKPTPQTNGNQPVHTVRHRNIKGAIWRNDTAKGPMYNVTVTRSYRDGEEWRDSNSFGYDDLMNLAAVLYEAHGFISSLRAKDYADDRDKPAAERRQRASA